ncbi:flagellar protein export ATPase FliI [Pseudomonas sp. B392_1p]|uniref:flagellar protein export ATPase FliI n=1 Tax=Pseudomonas sp. B392_1p TaxID=3457507 RepID=UPI003FD5546A
MLLDTAALDEALRSLDSVQLAKVSGRLVRVSGLILESLGCQQQTGQRCYIEQADGSLLEAQVVGFNRDITYLMPFKKPLGLATGARVFPIRDEARLRIDDSWLGRVLNALGEPLDTLGKLTGEVPLPPSPAPIHPLRRRPVEEPLDVGVRAINAMLTLGKGQRVGLFAGSGVGKSVLLGMITRQTKADVVVVGLIGERGREVQEFLLHSLGEEGLRKAVVVVAPANESPLMRLKAADLCHSIAAHFRDQGKDVLLLVDSLTRYAMAQREIALALGEPPATKGYPPSVFGMLPELVESAGNGEAATGSLSAIYTVLAEGDDQQDPIVDCARAILDGHIVLSRKLAENGHYPAIDIGASVSRCMPQVSEPAHRGAARQLKELYSTYEKIRELIPLGGYVPGMDAKTDRAVQLAPNIERFLRQETSQEADLASSVASLQQLLGNRG